MSELVVEVIESYNNYIENVGPGSIKIAEHLRKDEIQDAMQMILQFSEGMSWLVQASELLIKNGVKVVLETEKINEFLTEINNGLEMEDFVIVADMFEYEIAPFFEESPRIEGFES
ncbi:hypothetical protein MTP04_09420 [Lysinibacillus sp. PLM2]|nr:hypothetical protein MTP04_09420 [Lysinibacillus sp. PLM2]